TSRGTIISRSSSHKSPIRFDSKNPYINMWRNNVCRVDAKASLPPAPDLGRLRDRRGADTQLSLRTGSVRERVISCKRQANRRLIPSSPLLQLRYANRIDRLQPLFSWNLGYRPLKPQSESRHRHTRGHVCEWSAYSLLCPVSLSLNGGLGLFSRHKHRVTTSILRTSNCSHDEEPPSRPAASTATQSPARNS